MWCNGALRLLYCKIDELSSSRASPDQSGSQSNWEFNDSDGKHAEIRENAIHSRAEMNCICGLIQHYSRVPAVSVWVDTKAFAGSGGCLIWSNPIWDALWYICCLFIDNESTYIPTFRIFMAKMVDHNHHAWWYLVHWLVWPSFSWSVGPSIHHAQDGNWEIALLRCFERSSCGGGSWMGLCGPAQTLATILWRGKLDGVVRPCPNIYDNIVKGGMNGAVQPCPNIYNNIATLYLFWDMISRDQHGTTVKVEFPLLPGPL